MSRKDEILKALDEEPKQNITITPRQCMEWERMRHLATMIKEGKAYVKRKNGKSYTCIKRTRKSE